MNDLISRSELIKVLKERATNEAIAGYMTAYDVTNSIIDEAEEQPNAYDVEKVIEHLEEYREEMKQFGCDGILTDMLEIVKQGVLSDDYCEWKIDGVYLISPHNTFFNCVEDKDYRYNYCPVCGKKIKQGGENERDR